MHVLPKLSKVLRNIPGMSRGNVHSSPDMASDELAGDLKRELYGMGMGEQTVVKHILSMAGQVVAVRQDTVAADKARRPIYVGKGSQVKIAEYPLTIDPQGNMFVNIYNKSHKTISMRISDYMRDIYVSK